ncbi:MAG: hypothetical protein NTX25_01320 [Proteobacteria bacterium]|nr:hypothetical protein [Pseudomonadota bacterium]
MALPTKKLNAHLIFKADQLDLSKASYNSDLSSTDLDPESSSFHVTVDRLLFQKPLDMILTVLDANGFAKNFENILSCFDSLTQGLRIIALEKSPPEAPIQVKSFIPCLSFQLPSKGKVGVLLKKFYSEVESYELELAKLRGKIPQGEADKNKSREALKNELDRLKADHSSLQSKCKLLSMQLSMAMKSQASVTKALESNNIIPPQLKSVLVREIRLQERTVLLKSGRSSFFLPMALLQSLPKPGDACLLNLKDELIIDAYFYEAAGRPFVKEIAEVLHVRENSCKIRTSNRKTEVWTALNDLELQSLAKIKRGSKLIISIIDSVILKIAPLGEEQRNIWSHLVQEKQTIFQLESARQQKPEATLNIDIKE